MAGIPKLLFSDKESVFLFIKESSRFGFVLIHQTSSGWKFDFH